MEYRKKPDDFSDQEIESIIEALRVLLEAYMDSKKYLVQGEVPKKLQKAKAAFEGKAEEIGVDPRQSDEILKNYVLRVVYSGIGLPRPLINLPLSEKYVLGDLVDLMEKEQEYLEHTDNSDQAIRERIEKRKSKALSGSEGNTRKFLEEFYETIPNEFDKYPLVARLRRPDPYGQIQKFLVFYEELTGEKISETDLKKRHEEIILTIVDPNIDTNTVKQMTFYEVMQYMKAQLNRRKIEQQGPQKQKDARKISDSKRESKALTYVLAKNASRGEVPTQKEIAEHLGCSRETVNRKLQGDPPKWNMLATALKTVNSPERSKPPKGKKEYDEDGNQSFDAWYEDPENN